jgi:hypothetical protein
MRVVFPIRLSVAEKMKLARAALIRRLSLASYVRVAALETADRDLQPHARGRSEERTRVEVRRGEVAGVIDGGTRSPGKFPRRQNSLRTETAPPPEPEPVLRRAEQEALLGRPLFPGGAFEEYQAFLGGGIGPGGSIREGGLPR